MLGIAFVAIAASIWGLGNYWAQDDFPLIWKYDAVHHLPGAWQFFAKPYWPPPFSPDLYRPLALVTFALQWAVAGDTAIVFRIVSYLLYAACSIAVFLLARRLMPFAVAVAIGALFAAHPVHVEAVAMAVNQGEIWVGLLACLITVRYLRARAAGPLGGRDEAIMAVTFAIACLFKENALMIPGFLLAAELLLVRAPVPLRERVAGIRRFYLLLALVAVSFYWVRTLVLGGSLIGSFTAEGLAGLTLSGRALTMLQVVPHWARLLVWPRNLQADYSPQEISTAEGWGDGQTLGILLVAMALLLLAWTWRRVPVSAFGLAWLAIALFPVHNVLVPTGIVLAERTLFLPSIGFLIAVGGLAAHLLPQAGLRYRQLVAAATGALVVIGVYRSTTRHPIWEDQFTLWYQTANRDAPKSYRAHHALAEMYFIAGVEGRAEREYRLAIQYAPPGISSVYFDYANRLRLKGFCYPAIELYKRILEINHNAIAARASLIACQMQLGHYRDARIQSRLGIAYGWQQASFRRFKQLADSAIAANAPPGTVPLAVAPTDTVATYLRIGTQP